MTKARYIAGTSFGVLAGGLVANGDDAWRAVAFVVLMVLSAMLYKEEPQP